MSVRKDKVQLDLEINGKKAGQTYAGLKKNVRDLNREINKLEPGTEEFRKKTQELQSANKRLREVRDQVRGIDRSLVGTIKSAFSFQNVLRGIGQVLPSLGIASLISNTQRLVSESIRLFDVQAKAEAQVKQGLESTGQVAGRTFEELKRLASELQEETIFGDEEILQKATAQLLTFTNVTGEQFDRTQRVALDLATRLGGDLQSSTIQLGKALNDPITNLSSLSEAGIQFSEDQKAVIKELAETNRLAEAQTIILDELDKQYGGSAQAAAQAGTGGLQQFRNRLGDVQEVIGELVSEVLTDLIPTLDIVADGFEVLIRGVAGFFRFLAQIPQLIKDNKVELIALATALVTLNGAQLLATASAIKAATVSKALTLATRAQTIAMRGLNTVLRANPIGLVVSAIALLVTGLVQAYKRSEEVRAVIKGLGNVAKEVFTIVKESVGSFIEGFQALREGRFRDALNNIGEAIVKSNPIGVAFTQGKRLKGAFIEGYAESKVADAAEREAQELAQKATNLNNTGSNLGKQLGESINEGIIEGLEDDKKAKKAVKKSAEELLKERQEAAEIAFDRMNLILESMFLKGELTEEEYQDAVIELNRKYYDDRIALFQGYGEKYKSEIERVRNEVLAFENGLIEQENDEPVDPASILSGLQQAELGEDIDLKSQFLEGLIDEQEFNERRSEIEREYLDKSLNRLKNYGLEYTDTYSQLQDKLIQLQEESDDERGESVSKFWKKVKFYADLGTQALGAFFDFSIQALSRDEDARKKNAATIKSFQKGKVLTNLYSEISGYFTQYSTVPGGTIIAGILSGIALTRANAAIKDINAQEFYLGGKALPEFSSRDGFVYGLPNIRKRKGGDNMLAYLKVGETILNDDQVKALGGPAVMRSIGVPGYASGGLAQPTTVSTQPRIDSLPQVNDQNVAQEAVIAELRALRSDFNSMNTNLKAYIVYSEFEAKQSEVDGLRNRTAL